MPFSGNAGQNVCGPAKRRLVAAATGHHPLPSSFRTGQMKRNGLLVKSLMVSCLAVAALVTKPKPAKATPLNTCIMGCCFCIEASTCNPTDDQQACLGAPCFSTLIGCEQGNDEQCPSDGDHVFLTCANSK